MEHKLNENIRLKQDYLRLRLEEFDRSETEFWRDTNINILSGFEPEILLRISLIQSSGLFDEAYYRTQFDDRFTFNMNPLLHYVTRGWTEFKNPNPLFSIRYYLTRYADVKAAGIEPLSHYIECGSSEMRDPHPLFLNYHYASQRRKVRIDGTTWLKQFIDTEASDTNDKRISPTPLFDLEWYNAQVGKKFSSCISAYRHYLSEPDANIDFSPLFKNSFYRKQIGTKTSGLDAYSHYVLFGVPNRVDPHPFFDVSHYRGLATDCPSDLDPLIHFLWKGARKGLSPHHMFSPSFYAERHTAKDGPGRAFWHFVTEGSQKGYDPHPAIHLPEVLSLIPEEDRAPALSKCERLFIEGLPATDGHDLLALLGKQEDQQEPSRFLSSAVMRSRVNTPEAKDQIQEFSGRVHAQKDWPNILIVAHFVGEHYFGSERSFLDMLDAAGALPANVIVVLPKNVPSYTNVVRERCKRVFAFRYDWWRANQDIDPGVVATFRQIIQDEDIAIVHVNTIMLRECAIAARELSIPVVVHIRELIAHDQALCDIIGTQPQQIVSDVCERADWLIGNSHATAKAYDKPGRIFVIPNTIDWESMSKIPRPDGERLRFGLISSNIPKKGVLDFVALARLCQKQNIEAEFVLIGPSTALVEDLRSGRSKEEVPQNLIFAGYAESPSIAIAQVDVVMNLSHFAESFGRTILEAMAATRPVIAYEWGALVELIEPDRTGFLIPYKDPAAAVPHVKGLCENRQLVDELGRAGQARARKYDLNSFKQLVASAYRDILADRPKASDASPVEPIVLRARTWPRERAEEPLRLAYFCWHFPVPSETFVLSELEALKQRGIDVIVFCRQSPHKTFKPDFDIEFKQIVSVEDLAEKLIATRRTMVHAHFVFPTVTNMVWPACERANVPFTFIAHAQDIFVYKNDEQARLAEIGASKLCLRLFTLSQFHYDYILARNFPREKLVINPNAVSSRKFGERAGRERANGPKKAIAIHRFVEKKGLHLLIKAASLLTDLDLIVEIYGYGDMEAEYHAIIADLKLTNVILKGPLPHDEVPEVISTADLFVSPCVRTATGDMDGIPTSVVESMMAGIPVLTTPIAGIPDLIVDEVTGLICEPNPASVAAAIRRFFDLSSLKLRAIVQEAKKRAGQQHDVSQLVDVLLRVWQQTPIDVVVVSWNNLKELRLVLDRILAYTALPLHLIVCDNRSRKEPVPAFLDQIWAQDDRITVVHNRNNAMVGPGTNLAAIQGKGDTIIYVCGKEGMSFKSGWELPFVRAFEKDEKIGLVGTIGYSPSYMTGAQYPTGIRLFEHFRNKDFAAKNPDRVFGHIQGGLFAFRRRMFEEIGGFSEAVPHDYTDVEYSFYAESMGWKFAEAEGVLALFNKTRPSLSQRFDENVIVAHPVLPEQIATFEAVRTGKLMHCNICDWYGPAFSEDSGCHCPQCLASAMDRTLYRWMSETHYMFRRLVALSVGLTNKMEKVWNEQFQGPKLSLDAFLAELAAKGKLPNRPGVSQLAFARMPASSSDKLEMIAKELARLLAPGAPAIFQATIDAADAWDSWHGELTAIMRDKGFRFERDIRYSSKAVGLDYRPLCKFVRA